MHIEASLKENVDPAQVKALVDGQDLTAQAVIEASVLSLDVDLEDFSVFQRFFAGE